MNKDLKGGKKMDKEAIKEMIILVAVLGAFAFGAILITMDLELPPSFQQPADEVAEIEEPEEGELYIGYSQANEQGFVESRVVVDEGDILSVDLIEFDDQGEPKGDDYDWDDWHEAMEELPTRFEEANDSEVEIVSGATSTSEKAMEAVDMALQKSEGVTHFEGTYMGTSDKTDRDEWGVAWITVEGGQIVDVRVEEVSGGEFKGEDYDYEDFHGAKEAIPQRMKEEADYEVDIYTGATGSSERWMEAAERALEKAGISDLSEVEAAAPADEEGYVGYSQSDGEGYVDGYVEASVELSNGEIESVSLTEYDAMGIAKEDDYRWEEWQEAIEVLPERFIEANSVDVDIVSGATETSERAIEAVDMALSKAEGVTEFDGRYMGVSDEGRFGTGVAWVTIQGGEIIEVTLEEYSDGEFKDKDYRYDDFNEAREIMPERFVEANSSDVEVVSGATISSQLWRQAVERALEKAGYN